MDRPFQVGQSDNGGFLLYRLPCRGPWERLAHPVRGIATGGHHP
jgi:hypothetical protein